MVDVYVVSSKPKFCGDGCPCLEGIDDEKATVSVFLSHVLYPMLPSLGSPSPSGGWNISLDRRARAVTGRR